MCVLICLSVLAITTKVNGSSCKFFLSIGPEQSKKALHFGKHPDHILDTKISLILKGPTFNVSSMTFAFRLTYLQN